MKSIVIAVVVLFSISSYGQDKMSVIYCGFDNLIKINRPDEKKIKVKADSCILTINNGKHYINPNKPGIIEVSLFLNGKILEKRKYVAHLTPDPNPAIVGYQNIEKLTKDQIIKAGKLEAITMIDTTIIHFKIIKFSLLYHQGIVVESISNNEYFTPEQINIIKKLNPGDKLFFSDILALRPFDGEKLLLSSIIIKIIK